jgi:serine/threonine-protein kinase
MKTAAAIYTIAGNGQAGYSGDSGPARKAEFNAPAGLAIGPTGALFIADNGNDVIRSIAPRPVSRHHRAVGAIASATSQVPSAVVQAPSMGTAYVGAANTGTANTGTANTGTVSVKATQFGSGRHRHRLRMFRRFPA